MYLSLDQNLSKEIMKVLSLKLKILFFSFLSLYNYMPILVCSGLVPTAQYLTKSQPCIILDLLCMIHFSTIKEDFTQSDIKSQNIQKVNEVDNKKVLDKTILM